MVAWFADGNFTGYVASKNPINLTHDHYKIPRFASGAVDSKIPTRSQYDAYQLGDVKIPAELRAVARLEFSDIEFYAAVLNRNKNYATVTAFFVPDHPSFVWQGQINMQRIWERCRSGVGFARRGTSRTLVSDFVGGSNQRTYTTGGVGTGNFRAYPNTKWWMLIGPSIHATANPTNDPRFDDIVYDVPFASLGFRAISFLTNQTPNAPVLNGIPTGQVWASGQSVGFTLTSNDPDKQSGGVGDAYHSADLAGIQFQYAPNGSVDPDDWRSIDTYASTGVLVWDSHYIKHPGIYPTHPLRPVQENAGASGLRLHFGALGARTAGANLLLPPGDWQIRARTFDFGHVFSNAGMPFGFRYGFTNTPHPSNAPYANTSPWSAPIRVTIEAQVPPPILLRPINNTAVVEGQPVSFEWNYRNLGNDGGSPPSSYPQRSRSLQVREVGEPTWLTLLNDDLSSDSVFLSVMWDTTFTDDGTSLTNWSRSSQYGSTTYMDVVPDEGVVVTTPPTANGGGGFDVYTIERGAVPGEGLLGPARVRVWGNRQQVEVDPLAEDITPRLYLSNGGVPVDPADFTITASSGVDHQGEGSDYVNVDWEIEFETEADFDAIRLQFAVADSTYGAALYVSGVTLSTRSVIALEAGKQYEWRVQVSDTTSTYSEWTNPATFWVVPPPGSVGDFPLPTDVEEGATLGCGTHRVMVQERGNGALVGEITHLSHVDWSRLRDDMSTAKVVVSGWDIDCGNLLANLRTIAHEIVIYRDNGSSVDRVWEGPITLLTYETEQVTIHAKDVMFYAYRRIIRDPMNDMTGVNVVLRAERILQNTLAADNPAVLEHLIPLADSNTPLAYRATPPYSRTAFEEIDDMASNAGLDYTVVGRSIMLWGTRSPLGRLPEFRDSDLGTAPIVSEYGMSFANRYAISDGNGLWGAADRLNGLPADPVYGLVEMLSSSWSSDEDIDSTQFSAERRQKVIESFEAQSERSIDDRYPPPVVVRVPENTTINANAVLSIQHLVPGVAVPLRATSTLREVVATQKLDSVRVTEENGIETIAISLSRFGRADDEFEESGE